MRRENRRRPLEEGLDTKKMLYIVGSILALAVIAFVITFLIYGNQLNNDTDLARLDTNTIGTITATEETSNPYGKTVNEMENESNSTTNSSSTKNEENNSKIAVNTSQSENQTKTDKNNTTTTQKESSTNSTKQNKQIQKKMKKKKLLKQKKYQTQNLKCQ